LRRHCLKSDQSSETLIVGPREAFSVSAKATSWIVVDFSFKLLLFRKSDVLVVSNVLVGN